MTRDRYLKMCDQLGQEPDPTEIPPDWEDFPEIAQIAFSVFGMLGDRMVPDIGYLGKDYTNLPTLMEIHEITDKELFLEILYSLESRAIQSSQETLKREREKLKRKSSGRHN